MDRALRHGHGLVQYQRRAGHVLQLIKAMNARAADSVGIETRQILHMVNTNSPRRAAFCRASICPIDKSIKLQAPSFKRATLCHIDRSSKRQASSPKQQASSSKPQAASSRIREPRYMDIEKVFDALGPRAWAMINVLCGCFTWKAI